MFDKPFLSIALASSLATGLALTCSAQATSLSEADFLPPYQDYLTAVYGDMDDAEHAHQQFAALVEAHPDSPVALAYAGVTRSLIGRESWLPWKKMSLTEAGLDEMEAALDLIRPEHDSLLLDGVPASARLRAMTGITFTSVPNFFGRFSQGRELLEQAADSQALAGTPFAAQAYIHYYAGKVAAEDGDQPRATELLQRVIERAPQGEFAAEARAQLAELD